MFRLLHYYLQEDNFGIDSYSISREIVIKQWLNGRQRNTIALETGLSTGTVSSFINTWKEEVGNLAADELRELGVALRKTGTTPL